ncbi:MAG: periplasmic heavy metal sensor [Bryobacteraceae bacterium]|nr:periplasmic heavy metal sensor [Bryobacteraceae bacterium]
MKNLLLWMLMLAAPLMAQMPRGAFNWWESPLTRDINLTEDQRKQIQEAIRGFRPKLIDLRASLEKAELETEDALDAETLDMKRANEAIERLAASRADMTRTMSQMSIKFRSILTVEQWKDLQKRRAEMMRNRPGAMGPGQRPAMQRRMDRRDQKMQQRMPGMPGMPPGQNPPPPPEEQPELDQE